MKLFSALIPPEPFWIKTTVACVGTLSLAQSFCTVYIYAGEIFPTIVRNQGVGSCSLFGRIGAMIAPFIANLVISVSWIPPMIFGLVMILATVICYWLPETKGCDLPDTTEEIQNYKQKKTSVVNKN